MRTNLYATGRNYYDAITLLEELGFVCENGNDDSIQCLHNEKRMVFNISKQQSPNLSIFKGERLYLSERGIVKRDLGKVKDIYLDGGIETDKNIEITRG